jgi:chromosomal replication initiator protein
VNDIDGLWKRCAASLQAEVSEATWNVWLSGLSPISYDGTTFEIGARNGVIRARVESRFVPLLEETLAHELGGPTKVQLTVVEPAPGDPLDLSEPTPSVDGAAAAGPAGTEPSGDPDVARTGGGRERRPGRNNGATRGRTESTGGRGRETAAVSLDRRFTFEAFVAASSNRLAHAAAQAVAENPGRSYNPLFIYGESGLGKTHLLHAIGNYVQENFTRRTVLYVTTETFMNDFVDSLRMATTIAFKRRYRECDVLLIDDVQFMQNKEGLQEEFFHTYNDLHGASKQIVLTSDRPPKSIETLEDRLRSRFLSGLITEINPPDLETRLAILRTKAEVDQADVDEEILRFIATHVKDNIRELEGALIRVTALASLNDAPVTLELAERLLADIVTGEEPRRITPQMILDATAASYGFSVESICGPSRTRPLVTARQVAMYLVRDLTDFSYPAIARVFGDRDHTTVIHAVDKITTQMKERRQIYEQVTELRSQLKTGT